MTKKRWYWRSIGGGKHLLRDARTDSTAASVEKVGGMWRVNYKGSKADCSTLKKAQQLAQSLAR